MLCPAMAVSRFSTQLSDQRTPPPALLCSLDFCVPSAPAVVARETDSSEQQRRQTCPKLAELEGVVCAS